jgi:integrase
MDDTTTYDVRVYKTDVYKGAEVTTYWVRWKVAGAPKPFKEPFRHSGQADSFRSKLNSAAKDGKAFSITTGRPVEWERDKPKEPGPPPVTWYSLTLDYAKAKWKFASPNQRRSIAEALTDATEALFTAESPYPRSEVRRALNAWAYSARLLPQAPADPPEDIAPVLKWLETATIPVAALGDPETSGIHARAILDRISSKQDDTQAAPNTANRKRAVLNNLMKYAELERNLISGNPLKSVMWTKPRKIKTVDPRCVVNPEQACRFLIAVGKLDERGKRLKAFFGCMYYAALRPEEVIALRRSNIVSLPEQDGEWGEFLLTDSQSRSGSKWSNDGSVRPRRALKHRAEEETRPVPIHPDLVKLLRDHTAEFGYGPGGRIFSLPRGGTVTNTAYLVIFHKARTTAFTEAEAKSLVAQRPYDLRHACVSTWLNATGDPAQVAEWAGQSVNVLMQTYAKCVSGQQEANKKRIFDATRPLTQMNPTEAQRTTADDLAKALRVHGINKTMLALKKMWDEQGDGTPFPGDIHGMPEDASQPAP